jgi:hypothetical protein
MSKRLPTARRRQPGRGAATGVVNSGKPGGPVGLLVTLVTLDEWAQVGMGPSW